MTEQETENREEQMICGKCAKEEFGLDSVPRPHFPPGAPKGVCSNCGEENFISKRGGFRRTYKFLGYGIYASSKE